MILAIDVDYRETTALAAACLFEHWQAARPVYTHQAIVTTIADYEPGQFYKRELPCILQLLSEVSYPLSTIVVDGYVWLGDDSRPGLGAHLYQTLPDSTPVIGVAKSYFHANGPQIRAVRRGQSQKPLYVSSVGVDVAQAAAWIESMHGQYRIPDLLKQVDLLSKSWPAL